MTFMMAKASDLVAKRLAEETGHVFGVTGGCIVNLFDSIEKQKGLNLIPMHHEQACAMAADAYARVSKKLGVCAATSGPGITNLITGLACSYFDSVPVLAIGGQVPKKNLRSNLSTPPRQVGFQEIDCRIMDYVTKGRLKLENLSCLDAAIHSAKSGRKGPVFLEFCDDVQRENWKNIKTIRQEKKTEDFQLPAIKATRPLLILGAGVKNYPRWFVKSFVEILNIPTLLTWGAMDILHDDHPLNIRDFGVTSQRTGNFAIKNANFILAIGTRLDTHQPLDTKATVMVINEDLKELARMPGNYLKCHGSFINLIPQTCNSAGDWLTRLKEMRNRYSIFNGRKHPKNHIDPYLFIKELSEKTPENSTIITDAGQTLTWTMQSWKVKENQNLFSAFNNSPMGYALPASIGAYFGDHAKSIICLTGDGGLQMNIQELQTIAAYKIPVKIFVLDNEGYGMIRQTQSDWKGLKDNVACSPNIAGYSDYALCLGINEWELDSGADLYLIGDILKEKGPSIITVKIKPGAKIEPKLKFGDKLWDQTPKLSKKEVKQIDKFLQGSK